MKRAIILIDGQNLYYGLKDLKINEREIIWDKFLNSLIQPEDELVRTYWFRPQRILDTYYSDYNIRQSICFKKFNNHLFNFNNNYEAIPQDVKDKIEEEAVEVENWLKTTNEKFSQSEYKYDQISLDYGDIEIVKTGIVKVDPFKKIMIGEKGVDISLAVKMMSLSVQNRCEKIILVSGDYDYAEAIKFVKDNMTKIHLVKIHKGYPPQNKSVSRDLAVLADRVIDVYESELRTNFLKAI
ncbi:MAG: NYN domain-containing protein [Chitinophagaceae bacterium]|nr:NYN domain-containing protein [Chitinophagaceae bacterium]